MDDLTACYFCGTADGSVAPYPVVPAVLNPSAESRRTVTLCPTCREKLATVQEAIVAEVGTGPASPPEGPEQTVASDEDPTGTDDTVRAGSPPSGRTASATPTEADGLDEPTDPEADDSDRSAAGDPEDLPESTQRIVRLLQNRSFPVHRSDIETVATEAYDLDPGECADAIDGLVQRGLLVEEEGRLDRPGGRE